MATTPLLDTMQSVGSPLPNHKSKQSDADAAANFKQTLQHATDKWSSKAASNGDTPQKNNDCNHVATKESLKPALHTQQLDARDAETHPAMDVKHTDVTPDESEASDKTLPGLSAAMFLLIPTALPVLNIPAVTLTHSGDTPVVLPLEPATDPLASPVTTGTALNTNNEKPTAELQAFLPPQPLVLPVEPEKPVAVTPLVIDTKPTALAGAGLALTTIMLASKPTGTKTQALTELSNTPAKVTDAPNFTNVFMQNVLLSDDTATQTPLMINDPSIEMSTFQASTTLPLTTQAPVNVTGLTPPALLNSVNTSQTTPPLWAETANAATSALSAEDNLVENTGQSDDFILPESLDGVEDLLNLNVTPTTGHSTPLLNKLAQTGPWSVSGQIMPTPAQQVGAQMTEQLQLGRREVTFQLNPENLGQVRVQLTSVGPQQVAGRLIVETPDALHNLQQDMHQLKHVLSRQGIQLDSVTVVMAGGDVAAGNNPSSSDAQAGQGNNPFASQAGQSFAAFTQQQHQQAPPRDALAFKHPTGPKLNPWDTPITAIGDTTKTTLPQNELGQHNMWV